MIKYSNDLVKRLILALMTAALVACSSTANDELSRYINEIKARGAKPVEPIPEFVPLEKFVYPEQDARRSPFKQKEVIKQSDQLAPNTNRPKQPLEQFPLDALKFVGILKQNSLVWGLISQPNGEIARVKIGDYMGQNFGKIISINDTTLRIEETVQVAGKWEKKVTTFNLNASE
jgi:type IV pilus assembly protein PilP